MEVKDLLNVSYSALVDYKNCQKYFKFKRIDKIPCKEDTPITYHGKLIHKYVQDILSRNISVDDAVKRYSNTWKRFAKFYKKRLDLLEKKYDFDFMTISGEIILCNILEKFTEKFGQFKVLSIEELLWDDIEGHSKKFKGFIDIVLQLEDGNIVIADFKTCNSVYWFKENMDKFKQYQLTLYKKFYCKKHNIDPKNIETYFILLEINCKSKTPIIFERITSGNKKISNATEWLCNSLSAIERGCFLKIKSHCFAYERKCPFYDICNKK